MSLYDLLGWDFWLWIIAAVAFAIVFKRVTEAQWLAKFEQNAAATFTYKTEQFRSPINLSVTVASVLIPLVVALIAYLLINSTREQIGKMSSLFAGLCLLVFSMCWGVYQSYSLATASLNGDDLVITKQKNWKTPSHFVAQLTFLLTGSILIVVFLVFQLDVRKDQGASDSYTRFQGQFNFGRSPEREIVYETLRQQTQLGAPEEEVMKKWGTPDRIDRLPGERLNQYVYSSPTSTYIISCRDAAIVRFEMQKSEYKGER